MAEVADILSRPEQRVVLSDLAADCSMTDMASLAKAETARRELGEVLDPDTAVTRITCVNSAADLKAFCGRHGGSVCTSTNAKGTLQWALGQRDKVLFFPDQHLGRRSGHRLGLPLEEMAIWDFEMLLGGLGHEQIRKAKILLWNGHCSVHQMFRPQDIDNFKQKYPEAKVICHSECALDVCLKADYVGSTGGHPDDDPRPGARYALARRHRAEPGQSPARRSETQAHQCALHVAHGVHVLQHVPHRPQHFAWTLENLAEGDVVNGIKVPEPDASGARTALERMLSINA